MPCKTRKFKHQRQILWTEVKMLDLRAVEVEPLPDGICVSRSSLRKLAFYHLRLFSKDYQLMSIFNFFFYLLTTPNSIPVCSLYPPIQILNL